MERFDDRELKVVESVIRSGELSRFFTDFNGGKHNQAFEDEFANYLGCKYAIAVSNGTVALEVALSALEDESIDRKRIFNQRQLKAGDEVIVTPLTFIATATAILRSGLKPVFVDIDPETLNMDELLVEEAITRKTKAVLSVSLLGKPARMDILQRIAIDHKLWLIEDAAQALGARSTLMQGAWRGDSSLPSKIGNVSDIATFSFQESKTITTLGEGGMIATNSKTLADLCRHIRNHGNTYGTMTMNQTCTNARMTEAQAAFGRVQLSKLDEFIRIQRENAEVLFGALKSPLKPCYTWLDSTYYLIPYILEKGTISREDFIVRTKNTCPECGNYYAFNSNIRQEQRLTYLCGKCGNVFEPINQGVPGENIGYYKKLVYDNPIFAKYKPKDGCKNAEWARDNIILFDIHRWNKTPEDMKSSTEVINKILKS